MHKFGEAFLNIGVTGVLIGMVVATFMALGGYAMDPVYFRWFMGASFVAGLTGAAMRDKEVDKEEARQTE